ncbi:MAG TPA: hypothetical protein VFN10_21950 [Thermoanaerobaculia bacterium]|nr:hypothetical protein [Thermoanaerobaculia bacterium]
MAHRAVGPSVHDLALTLQLQVCDVICNLRDLGVAVFAPTDTVPAAVAATLIAAARSPKDEEEIVEPPSPQLPDEVAVEMKSFFASTLDQLQTMTALLQEISGKLDNVATSDDMWNVADTTDDVRLEVRDANERARGRRW